MGRWWSDLNKLEAIEGQDYSSVYTRNKNAFFYVGREGHNNKVLVFKPFLKDLTYSVDVKTNDLASVVHNANPDKAITGVDTSIKVSLILPAVSLDESIANIRKVRSFMSWLRPSKSAVSAKTKEGSKGSSGGSAFKPSAIWCKDRLKKVGKDALVKDYPHCAQFINSGKKKKETPKEANPKKEGNALGGGDPKSGESPVSPDEPGSDEWGVDSFAGEEIVYFISFANLIQSGKYKELHTIMDDGNAEKTHTNLMTYGLRCFITNIKTNIEIDMGFFEQDANLYPKVQTLSFDINMINTTNVLGTQNNIIGFGKKGDVNALNHSGYKDGAYHSNDVKYWPFGASYTKKKQYIDYTYTKKKGAWIKISKYDQIVNYKPYLKSFSIQRKIDKKNVQEYRHLTGKNRIVFDTKQPQYGLSFSVVCNSVNEAKHEHYQLQKLMRMIYPAESLTTTATAELSISFSNLISSAGIFKSGDAATFACTKLSIKPNFDMGFFENKGMLWMKAWDLSLSLEMIDGGFASGGG